MFHHPLGIWGAPWTTVTADQETGVPGSETPTITPLWCDQPDYYNTTLLPRYWDGEHADAQVDADEGYSGGDALTGSSIDAYVYKFFPNQTDFEYFGVGQRIKVEAAPSAEKILLAAIDGSGNIQVCATLRTDRKVSIWRGNLGTLLVTSADTVPNAQHLRLGFKGRISPANGSAEVYLDGDVLVRVNGVSTVGSPIDPAPAVWRGVYIGLYPDYYVSHMYGGQGDGALLHDLLVAVGRGNAIRTNEWTAVGAGTIVLATDDTTANDDTDYAESASVGSRFALEREDIASTTEQVYGTRAVMTVKNGTGSTASIAPLLVNPDGERDYGTWRSASDSEWRAIDRFDAINPFTGAPWTAAEINGNYGWGGETAT